VVVALELVDVRRRPQRPVESDEQVDDLKTRTVVETELNGRIVLDRREQLYLYAVAARSPGSTMSAGLMGARLSVARSVAT
jgi:hypothetical protein